MHSFPQLLEQFKRYLDERTFSKEPAGLYEPVNYIMSLGGKRVRPVLLLMGCELFSEHIARALPAALAVETFHNFSLMHDDIMDEAPLRRGKPTAHVRFGTNQGILSGDLMLIYTYEYLLELEDESLVKQLLRTFNDTAVKVCEGQQWDMAFETRDDVSIEEYLLMIEYKTAVLLASALEMGALIGGAAPAEARKLYEFGRHLGIAFQLLDDLLDTFGDPEKFGKKVGGDIAQNKKTYLYLRALELSDPQQRATLRDWYTDTDMDEAEKIAGVRKLFEELDIPAHTRRLIEDYQQSAFHHLQKLEAPAARKAPIIELAHLLAGRET